MVSSSSPRVPPPLIDAGVDCAHTTRSSPSNSLCSACSDNTACILKTPELGSLSTIAGLVVSTSRLTCNTQWLDMFTLTCERVIIWILYRIGVEACIDQLHKGKHTSSWLLIVKRWLCRFSRRHAMLCIHMGCEDHESHLKARPNCLVRL
jgi:hypothetical protein